MLITLTNINSEMKSMAVYSALFAMVIHWTAGINEFSFATAIYGFENQLNAGKSGRENNNISWTHRDKELDLDYVNDEIRRAENEVGSERIEEYTFPSICSPELDSPV